MEDPKKKSLALFCEKGMVFALCALIYFLPISIALTDSFAGLAIAFYFCKKLFLGPRTIFTSTILGLPLIVLVWVTLVSVLQSHYFALSLLAFFGKFVKYLLLYLTFIEAVTSLNRLRLFTLVFLFSAFLTGLSAVFQHFNGWDFLRGHRITAEGRVTAGLDFPTSLGIYLLPVLGLCMHLLYYAFARGGRWYAKLGLAVLFVVLSLALGFTFARAAWVGFICSLIFMVVLDSRKWVFIAGIYLAFILLFQPALHEVRHMTFFTDSLRPLSSANILQQGGSGRRVFWENALVIIRHSPLWGSGLNTYARMLKDYSLSEWYAHNSYLQMAAETGIIGLAVFLWLLFVFFKHALSCLPAMREGLSKAIAQGVLTGLVGFLVNAFFDNSLYAIQLTVLFWMMLGFAMAAIRLGL